MIGRTLGLVTELDADLQPAGWRLTGTSGAPALDQRRARSLLGQDLDGLEEQAAGPRRASRCRSPDHGRWPRRSSGRAATRCWPTTVPGATSRRRWRRALPTTCPTYDAACRGPPDHRPGRRAALPAVLAGAVPTASGFGRHRTVHPPEASEALGWVLSAVRDAGAEPWVHCCAPEAPLALLRGAGAVGLAVDLSLVGADGHDALAEALEAGETVALGVVPTTEASSSPPSGTAWSSRCCAGSTWSASTRPRSALRWSSRRPAVWPAPTPRGHAGRSSSAARWPRPRRVRRATGRAPRQPERPGRLVMSRRRPSCQSGSADVHGPSAASVASSVCLTLRKIQITADAASIMKAPTRNAALAPEVKLPWKIPIVEQRRLRCPGPAWSGRCRPGRTGPSAVRRSRRPGCW